MGKTLKVVELVGNFPLSVALQLCRRGLRQPKQRYQRRKILEETDVRWAAAPEHP